MTEPRVLCLTLDDGKVQPLAWTDSDLSKRELRHAVRKFKRNSDVTGGRTFLWSQLYATKAKMKQELPYLG